VRQDAVGSKRVRTRPHVREAAMSSGLILLILIGIVVAYAYTRLRGKMKLPISGKSWIGPIFIVALVVLMLFSKHQGH
jgi:hypothetical protein